MSQYRIISTQKQTALVVNTKTNEQQACFFSRKHKPICGDYVEIQTNKNEYIISNILPHRNVFARANHNGQRQNIAANVDNQIIVVAVQPEPTRDLINRYLIAAHNCGMRAIIVFNKNDIDKDFFNEINSLYQSLGYITLSTNATTQTDFTELIALMTGKTSIFVGMSGVGKSSISEIILHKKLKTGEISKKTGKGSHVTSVTQMYKIPNNSGYLIDSPGVWEYGLWKMGEDEIAAGFSEISSKAGQCKFSNCTHTHEPKCAVKKAVENHEISSQRYDSYLRIIDSMKYWK
ncbi:Ribosome small subunit biogenesis RbfA-release protein RsgA [hydrothermal vent metagenome]|uniref:Ribosome small subunit biogenesis RbfA-release protein RsgA n=1 Tax=hydrothermal vent metagenome TaxID=652676 RepID=A0A3B0VPS0_9ZZZZ